MSAEVKHSIDRYTLQAFLLQVRRVFGVEPYFTMRADFADVLPKLSKRNTDRANGLCFVRPDGFSINRQGYRAHALVGRGQKGSVAATANVNGKTVPSQYNVIHPVATITRYEVTFSAESFTEISRLWSIWAQCSLQSSLSFRINYQDQFYDVSCVLTEELIVPEAGQRGQEREDAMRTVGQIEVHGYTSVVTDPHVVPVILFPEVEATTLDHLT